MYLAIHKIPNIAEEFISSVLIPKAPTPAIKFTLGFILPYIAEAVDNKMKQLTPTLQSLSIINDLNKIDLDKAKGAAYSALQSMGGSLVLYGYSADKEDIDSLLNIAQKYAVNE